MPKTTSKRVCRVTGGCAFCLTACRDEVEASRCQRAIIKRRYDTHLCLFLQVEQIDLLKLSLQPEEEGSLVRLKRGLRFGRNIVV